MSKQMPVGSSLTGWMRGILAQARSPRALAQTAGALGAMLPIAALANPNGGQVVAGSATIGTAGSNGVVINQNTQRASINWQQFSVGGNEYVQFNQPNSSSVVLNRVIGSNPSSIFGNIRANGQVFLINPNGILFAPGSTLDVSSLTASTLDISDANFMAGRYVFSKDPGAPDASVVNQGKVTVTSGGYVVLAGDYVENDGVINAQSGKVLLAASGAATLTLDNGGGLISYKIDAPTLARLAGVDNAGSITANGGAVVMTADVANALTATAVNNSGLVTAHSVSQQGGVIVLLSDGGGIENSGTLDASATQAGVAGGTVIVKGNGRTRITDTSVIDTAGYGARGGFIEVSGHELNLRGLVHAGKGGTLLLDPKFLHIVSGSGNNTSASTNNVGVNWISSHLQSGNVLLQASTSIVNTGHVARTIHPLSGSGNLTLQVNDGPIDIQGLTIDIKGALAIQAATGASGGSIKMNGATAKAITLHASTIAVHGALSATSGGISITGRTSRGNHSPAFSISGAMHATGRVLVSYSNEGGVPTGYLNMKDVTGGTIKIVGEKITTGNLTATQSGANVLVVDASGSSSGTNHINPASVHVTGSVIASHGGVTISAHTGSGVNVTGNITGGSHVTIEALDGGNVTVGGSLKTNSGGIFISAAAPASHSGGNISVTGGITAKGSHAGVLLKAAGGGTSDGFGGGNITVGGAIQAAGSVTINASYLDSGHSFKVQTGNITAGNSGAHSGGINISMTGNDPVLVTGALLAEGPLHPCGSANEACHARTGDIIVSVNPSATGSSSIKLASVKSSHGKVSIDGSAGLAPVTITGAINAASDVEVSGNTVHTGAITAGGDVDITGTVIHVGGAITDIGGSVCLTGEQASTQATAITVTGTIKSGMVQVKASLSSLATHGASIDLAKVSSSLAGGIMIAATAASSANVKTMITVGSIHATGGGHVDITQAGASGGIKVTGPISVTGNGVDISASGGAISVGAITATGGIQLHDGAGQSGGGITVTGNLTGSDVSIDAFNSSGSGAKIKVTGKVIGHNGVTITSDVGSNSGGSIKVTGLISASNGGVGVHASGGGDTGGRINLGSVAASGAVSIAGTYKGSVSGFTLQTGKITAKNITVTMTGKDPVMTVAGLKTTGSSGLSCECGHGFARLQLHPTGNSGSIDITGGITTTHGGVTLDASHGAVNLNGNSIVTGGSGSVSVLGGQVHLGNINAGGGISISAAAAGSHAGSITAGATDLWIGKYVNIDLTYAGGTNGNIAIGAVTATGNASSSNSHGGQVNITASLPAKKVIVSTGTLTANTSLNVQIQNASGSATLGKLNAPVVQVKVTQGNLKVGQLVQTGAVLSASHGSITDSTTGSLHLLGDTFNAANGVHLKAGTNITLVGDSFGTGPLSASAGGNLIENSSNPLNLSGQVLKAGKQMVLSANTIDLGDAKLTAGSIQISATSISNSSAQGSITAAAGTIHATHGISLVGENINVSGTGPLISAASVDLDNAVVSGTGVLSVKAKGNLDASSLNLKAGGLTMQGGSVDLTGAKITATKAVKIASGKNVNIGSTQISGSAVGITAGGDISNGSGAAGALTAGAGALTLKAKGDVQLAGETLAIGAGGGSISATGSLSLANTAFTGAGSATLHAGTDISLTGAKMTLGGVTMDAAGGSVDLTGLTADVTGQMTLQAKQDIILSAVHVTTGIFAASASGTIHNGGAQGAITAAAMKFDAKKNIDMSSTVLTIGAGAVTGVTGDAQLLQLLAALGLKPGSDAPNGAFVAGGSVTLGALDITGNYLVLQGSSISILGPVTAPTSGLLVEVRPGDPTQSIDVEDQAASGAAFDIGNKSFLALFPGDTIVISDDAETGDVTIGNGGAFTLAGGTNLLFDTTGTITGLSNLISTGLVGSLVTVAAAAGNNDVVTAGEIDPSTTTTSLGDQTDKKHLGHNGQGFGNGEGQNGIIGTDTDTSSVCH